MFSINIIKDIVFKIAEYIERHANFLIYSLNTQISTRKSLDIFDVSCFENIDAEMRDLYRNCDKTRPIQHGASGWNPRLMTALFKMTSNKQC